MRGFIFFFISQSYQKHCFRIYCNLFLGPEWGVSSFNTLFSDKKIYISHALRLSNFKALETISQISLILYIAF